MSTDSQTPSAAKLRHVAATIAQDITNVPIANDNNKELQQLNLELQTFDKSMNSTSETISSVISTTKLLSLESHNWPSIDSNVKSIISKIDRCLSIFQHNSGSKTHQNPISITTPSTETSEAVISHQHEDLDLFSNADAVVVSSDSAHP